MSFLLPRLKNKPPPFKLFVPKTMSKLTLPLLTICHIAATDNGAHVPFIDCLQKVTSLELPVKTGYWLEKILKAATLVFEGYNAQRIQLIQRLGVKQDDGNFTVPDDKLEEFNKELTSLDHAVELPIDEGFKLDFPKTYTPAEWRPVTSVLDIFNPPE